ncbi:ComGF family competence protein [Companilactobacillus zhachilii]|nr:ComGF family competence protein [Companilactobacillus zhachilii]
MIAIMTLGALQESIQLLKTIQKTSFRDQVRWHITQEKLQDVLGKAQIIKLDEDIIIYQNDPNKRMVLEAYGGRMLRIKTADNKGHEPIMTNLNKINIEKIQNLVIITTENKAGQKSQMCIINDP